MRRLHDHPPGVDDAQRLLFRSTHIYLLLASLLKLYLTTGPRGWRRVLRLLGSGLVVVIPVFAEPWLTELQRPYSRLTAYASLAGMLLHALSWLPKLAS